MTNRMNHNYSRMQARRQRNRILRAVGVWLLLSLLCWLLVAGIVFSVIAIVKALS